MSNARGLAPAYSKSTTISLLWAPPSRLALRSSSSSASRPPLVGVMSSKLPYCVSLCAKTRLDWPAVRSCWCTKARYRRSSCSNWGRLSAARMANVRETDARGGTCSESEDESGPEASPLLCRTGPEGDDAAEGVETRRAKPGNRASSSSSRRTFLASRVHRVMFSHTHSLCWMRERRPPDDEPPPRRRDRFLSSALDSLAWR